MDTTTTFDLSSEYPLTDKERESYQRDGHILLRGVVPQEKAPIYRNLVLDVVDKVTRSQDAQGRITDYGAMFTQVTNVWRENAGVREFIFAKRFAKIAADLMGVKGVRIYHDQALIKEPGGKPTPWHQDYYYWPLDTDQTITMWMPLVDVSKEMGLMSFVSGSHKKGAFKEMPISDTSQEYFEGTIKEKKFPVHRNEFLRAGDATFHSGRLLHSAHPNNSSQRREVITVIYYADGTRVMKPDNKHRKVDAEVFLPDQKAGELAASELNPLLYTR
jgi:ectoine hydroxylase-related dioxygenase (phytanoyl-CoA dioxygenase family)